MSVAINPKENTEKVNALGGESKGSGGAYDTNYVLVVLEVMQKLGLGPLEDVMQTEAKLMDVTAEIQSDLTTIQEYLTRIQNLSSSGGDWKMGSYNWSNMPSGQQGWLSPNGYNGIAYNEFHENNDITGDPRANTVAADFQNATANFIAAFKDLFMCTPCQSGDPNAASNFSNFSLSKMDSSGNTITKTFDLSSIYGNLDANKTTGWGMLSQYGDVFSTSSGSKASLIQQYTFYQYKLAAENYSGMPDNLSDIGFNMDPTSTSFDGVGKSLWDLLNSFNTTVNVNRENDQNYENAGELSNTSGNFLGYIFGNSYGYQLNGEDSSGSIIGRYDVNIYGAFAYAAFNYFWTKNPSASTAGSDNTTPQPPNYDGKAYSWDQGKGIVTDGDKLSIWYSNSQSSSSLISSNSNEASTTMQQYTSEVSQYQNIGQNIIKSASDSNLATIQNFKTG